ncbi:MAG: beta-ketoacyl-[acyl-carrier-protein] synthase family protein, partial [Thermogutta sp.]|nr:beta-ketoacyl-[acyl-carrier-protein] synthase family protein [Thermogutta sp.]
MPFRETVITGIGIVSPIGIGRDAFRASLLSGISGVGPITQFDPSGLPVRSAAEVRNFDAKQFVPQRKSLKVMARDAQLGVAASLLARQDAGLGSVSVDPGRFGVVLGADRICGSLEDSEPPYRACIVHGRFDFGRWGVEGMAATFPLSFLKVLPNMIASHISIVLDARGPNNTIHHSEVSSLLAVIEGTLLIERGLADVVMVGGAASEMTPFDWGRFAVMGRLSARADRDGRSPRPFDRLRDGEVRGEGAAIFVLEREKHALARGAEILGRIRGCGRVFHRDEKGEGVTQAVARAVRVALQDAEVDARSLGHVNADGRGTPQGDACESRALAEVLPGVPLTAPKSFFGNAGAATGALEL